MFIFPPILKLLHLILGLDTPHNFPPPLPAKEEEEAFRKARAGDGDARQTLILHNLRLVSHIVRKYYSMAGNQEDLVSIGTIGLVKAVDTFKIDNGARFATYAAKCIQNEILMHFRSQKRLSVEENLPEEVMRSVEGERALTLVRTRLDPRERQVITLRFGLNGAPALTQREVADRLGISRSYVSRIEKAALEKLKEGFGIKP